MPHSDGLDIAVLVPCYNEAAAIAKVVADFRAALPTATVYVYDNNSTDDTAKIAAVAGAEVRRERRKGKGNVVRRMFQDIEADVYVMVDGDDTYEAAVAPQLVEELVERNLDMLVGKRVETHVEAYRAGHRLGNAVLTGLVARLFGSQIEDMLSGYRVFSRRFVKSFPSSSREFEIETELTVHALQMRMDVAEIETKYKERPPGSTSKLRTFRDGYRILVTIMNLMRNERPLLFFAGIGVLCTIVAVALGVPIVLEFNRSGQVPRLPTALICSALGVVAAVCAATGLILDLVAHVRRENKRLAYLSFPLRANRGASMLRPRSALVIDLGILAAAWLAFVVYAYPGYMSTDSVAQLMEARSGKYGDWYPPAMSLLWSVVDHVVAGPFPMLVIQSVAFVGGTYGVLRHAMPARAAAIVAGVVLLAPPVLSPLAVIWKDSQMAGFLVAGFALVLAKRRGLRIAGLALLALATAQRYNAPAATLPLVALTFVWRDGATRVRRYAIALAAWLALTVVAVGANKLLTDEQQHPWQVSVATHDLTGMVRDLGEADQDDATIQDELPGVPLVARPPNLYKQFRARYNPNMWWFLSHGDGRLFDPPTTDAELSAVTAAWWHMASSHPVAYMKHRWRIYTRVLGTVGTPMAPVWVSFVENPAQLAMVDEPQRERGAVQTAWGDYLVKHNTSWLFKPWLYAIIGLLLVPFAARHRLVLALLASGLAYELGLLFAAPSSDYRYSHWMIVCVVVTIALLISIRSRGANPPLVPRDRPVTE